MRLGLLRISRWWTERGRTGRLVVAVTAATAVVAGLIGSVLLLDRPEPVTGVDPVALSTAPAAATEAPATAAPSPSPTVSPTPTPLMTESPAAAAAADQPAEPAATNPAPRPQPTKAPSVDVGPLPPPPAADPPPRDCPYYEGENASTGQVEAALGAAATRQFWTVSQVSVPANLVKAVAWQESGWQSAIIACDGGIGTMQVMPGTADWMNTRFGLSYDVDTLEGNTMLGSATLQWSIKYFADVYFDGDYTLRDEDCRQDPQVPAHREWCLLNAVISAYNYGFGAVDARVAVDDGVYYPNHQYIENVRALMGRY